MAGDPIVAVVGAGFGGLNVARALADAPVRVRLIDRYNYHTFQPLLYQVATGFLEASSTANNVRAIFRGQANLSFTLGEVLGIDPRGHALVVRPPTAEPFRLGYDFLILAPGVQTSFFGVRGAEKAFTLKSLNDAIRLRNHIVRQFELADSGAADSGGALTFVIVGGGSTGIELAGAMSDLLRHTLKRQFPPRITKRTKISLVEGSPRLLPGFHPDSGRYAERTLRRRGVDVLLGARVDQVDEQGILLGNGHRIDTQTVVWVAGVGPTPLISDFSISGLSGGGTAGGRLVVDPMLALRNLPDIFVIGDAAATWDSNGLLYPQVAPVAIEQGRQAAGAIVRRLKGLEPEPFHFLGRGIMATIGRDAAIAELRGGLRFYGRLAWAMWLGLHLVELIGFRNRANVLLDWAWNYITYHQGAGLMACEGL